MSPGPSKQFDREEVLERAMQLFWEQGYEATGMTQLLERMGIGRQSLYDTYGDKRSLFLEALHHYYRTQMGPSMAQLRAPGASLDSVRQVFLMWEKMIEEGHLDGCLVGNAAAELARQDPEIAKQLAGYFLALEDAFHEALQRAQEAGELSSRTKPRDLARVFVNMIQGIALISRVVRDPAMAKSVLRSGLAMLDVE